MDTRPIYITESDLERLKALVKTQRAKQGASEYLTRLEAELEKAAVVPAQDIPPDTATMHSTVELTDLDSGEVEVHTLVFPEEADLTANKLSILAPIGTAVLGYRTGDEFEWKVPAGVRRLRLSKVIYQPEAAGDYHL